MAIKMFWACNLKQGSKVEISAYRQQGDLLHLSHANLVSAASETPSTLYLQVKAIKYPFAHLGKNTPSLQLDLYVKVDSGAVFFVQGAQACLMGYFEPQDQPGFPLQESPESGSEDEEALIGQEIVNKKLQQEVVGKEEGDSDEDSDEDSEEDSQEDSEDSDQQPPVVPSKRPVQKQEVNPAKKQVFQKSPGFKKVFEKGKQGFQKQKGNFNQNPKFEKGKYPNFKGNKPNQPQKGNFNKKFNKHK